MIKRVLYVIGAVIIRAFLLVVNGCQSTSLLAQVAQDNIVLFVSNQNADINPVDIAVYLTKAWH